MRYLALIMALVLCATHTAAGQQTLSESPRSSKESVIYPVGRKALRDHYLKGREMEVPTGAAPVARYMSDGQIPELPRGNYLIVRAEGNMLSYTEYTVDDLSGDITTGEDMKLKLYDSRGEDITDAVVKAGGRKIRYSAAAGGYPLRTPDKNEVLEVEHDGVYHYMSLAKNDVRPYWGYAKARKPSFFSRMWRGFKGLFGTKKPQYEGFVVFSKPIYRPGETVRLKAHVVSRGKPYPDNVDLQLYGYGARGMVDTVLVNLAPYRAGFYEYEFTLTDSLRLTLDRSYSVNLIARDKKNAGRAMAGSFRYEDYELKDVIFSARTADGKSSYVRGDSIKLAFKVTDQNENPVYDGRVEITVTPASPWHGGGASLHTRSAFVPDTLWRHTLDMSGRSEAELPLPDSIFPAGVSLGVGVACNFLNADNEKRSANLRITRNATPNSIDFSFDKGRLSIRESAGGREVRSRAVGREVRSRAVATGYGERGRMLTDTLQLPCTVTIPWYISSYHVESPDASGYYNPSGGGEPFDAAFVRSGDSVRFTVDNPAGVPVWYTVRAGDKVVDQGYTGEPVNKAWKAARRTGYGLQLSWIYGGQALKREYYADYRQDNLSLDVSVPPMVDPGGTAQVDVTVSDRKGRPVAGADITAYAFTTKFGPQYNPRVSVPADQRPAKRFDPTSYTEGHLQRYGSAPLDWAEWSGVLGLDSVEFYRFLYPRPVYVTFEPAQGGGAEISPYVIVDGRAQQAQLLWIDGRLRSTAQADHSPQPNSYAVKEGSRTVKIRTFDRTVEIGNVPVRAGMKTILSVDGDASSVRAATGDAAGVTLAVAKYETPQKRRKAKGHTLEGRLSDEEMGLLDSSMVSVENLAGTLMVAWNSYRLPYYIKTRESIYPLGLTGYGRGGRGSMFLLSGPFEAGEGAELWSDTTLLNRFAPKPGHNYTVTEDQVWERKWRKGLLSRQLENTEQTLDFGEHPVTQQRLMDGLNSEIINGLYWRSGKLGTEDDYYYYNYYNAISGMCRLQLEKGVMADGTSMQPVFILMDQLDPEQDSLSVKRIYYGGTAQFNDLHAGGMSVSLVFADSTVYTTRTDLYKGGMNYLKIDSITSGPDREIVRRAFGELEKMMSKRFPPVLDSKRYEFYATGEDGGDVFRDTYSRNEGDAATGVVRGRVTDIYSYPIVGVSIIIPGTRTVASTSLDGEFSIFVGNDDELEISFIGYSSVTAKFEPGYSYLIRLDEAPPGYLQQVVVAGMTSYDKRSFKNKDSRSRGGDEIYFDADMTLDRLSSAPEASMRLNGMADVSRELEGKAMGVAVEDVSTTFGSAAGGVPEGAEGLPVVVDGKAVAGGLAALDLNSMNIVKIEVIREDMSAKYGAWAAGGVIVITTGGPDAAQDMFDGLPAPMLRTDFRDDAFWKPAMTTDRDGRASFEVEFPDDITRWRANFIAVGPKYGQTNYKQEEIKSFRSLAAQLAMPRFAVEGDSLNAIGKLTNLTGEQAAVRRTVTVGETSRQDDIRLDLSHVDTIAAVAGNPGDSLTIAYSVQRPDGYSDGERRSVEVMRRGLEQAYGEFRILREGQDLIFNPDTTRGPVTVHAEASGLESLLREIEVVTDYRYLCNEQMASKVKALLAKKRIYDHLGREFGDNEKIEELIGRIGRNVNGDRLWGWWGQGVTEAWISMQVVDALLQAEESGYRTSLDRQGAIGSLKYRLDLRLRDVTGRYSRKESLEMLVMLRRLGAPIDYPVYFRAIDSSHDGLKNVRVEPGYKVYALEAMSAIGMENEVDAGSILPDARRTMFGSMFWGEAPRGLYRTMLPYSNNTETTLAAYRLLRRTGGYETELERIRDYFFEMRAGTAWRNTYESSRIIETILPDILRQGQEPDSVRLWVAGRMVTKFPYTATLDNTASVVVGRSGPAPVFFTAYQTGWESDPEVRSEGFEVETEFRRGGNVLTQLQGGEPVSLVAKVRLEGDAEYVMIEIPIPAGCSYEQKARHFRYEIHREHFRDRVTVFCSMLPAGEHEFTVELIPRFSGSYTLNPASAKLMYFPVFSGNNEVGRIGIE